VRHAVFQHQIGEIGEAQQGRFFAAQFDDARDQRPIIA
jgi:hypothetical protein